MSLIQKMTDFCSCNSLVNQREYVELLRSNNPADLERLGKAMLALQKSASDLQADKALLDRVAELRGAISAARSVGATAESEKAALDAYSAETRRMNEERAAGQRHLALSFSSLLNTRRAGEEAVQELKQLISDRPELLRDEPPVMAVDA